ncbi:hypothetical protein ABIE49_005367 [Bradyrhizobium sp. OAE829]
MSCEQKTLVKTTRPEDSMSYAMIVIGGGVGNLAAAIYSAVASRVLTAQAPARERHLPAAYSQQG